MAGKKSPPLPAFFAPIAPGIEAVVTPAFPIIPPILAIVAVTFAPIEAIAHAVAVIPGAGPEERRCNDGSEKDDCGFEGVCFHASTIAPRPPFNNHAPRLLVPYFLSGAA